MLVMITEAESQLGKKSVDWQEIKISEACMSQCELATALKLVRAESM